MSASRGGGEMQDTSRGPRTVLFVAGFPPDMRASQLGYEFERWGRVLRCDIPAIKSATATPYAFVEFSAPRDAEEALRSMNGVRFGRFSLTVQFAKKAPSTAWRYDGGGAPSRRDWGSNSRRRSRSPRRRDEGDRDRTSDRRNERDDRREEDRRPRREAEREREQPRGNDREEEPRRDDERQRERSPAEREDLNGSADREPDKRQRSSEGSATPRQAEQKGEVSPGRDESPVA